MDSILVTEEENNSRLDRVIKRVLGNINQALLEKFLRQKLILVENKKAKSSQRVKKNQVISYSNSIIFNKNKKEDFFSKDQINYYKLLFSKILIKETRDWISINKPNRLAVQGGTKQNFHIDNFLKVNFNDYKNKPKLVHRLDKDTSGLLLIAKNQVSARNLSKYFKEGKITKVYYALVSPCPKNQEGIINTKIDKRKSFSKNKMFVSQYMGKKAITKYLILDKLDKKLALVALFPVTGRTHQLRLHMYHIGSPIIGDKKYSNKSEESILLDYDKELKLHAAMLKIPNEKILEADLPRHFKDAMKYFGLDIKDKRNVFNLLTRDEIENKKTISFI